MRFSSTAILLGLSAVPPPLAAVKFPAALRNLANDKGKGSNGNGNGNTGDDEDECTILVRAGSIFDEDSGTLNTQEESFYCQEPDGTIASIEGSDLQTKELLVKLKRGELVSSASALDMPGLAKGKNKNGDPTVVLPNGKIKVKGSSNGRGNGNTRGSRATRNRKLAKIAGTKPVLVVRVTDGDNLSPMETAAEMSNYVYGTNGDTSTMLSQFDLCSYGALTLTNDYIGTGVMSQTQFNNVDWAADGVIEVTTSARLATSVDSVQNEAVTKAAEKLGLVSLENSFEQGHVMLMVEDCKNGCGWAAYAYLNSYLSLYRLSYGSYPGVGIHELGHNLNLGHSGEALTYDDHTCQMGNALFGYDQVSMCFNPAKNFQLTYGTTSDGSWYPNHFPTINLLTEPDNRRQITLVGVAERDEGDGSLPIGAKLETGTSTDYYVAFNRATGMTGQNGEAGDLVTVIEAGANGLSYSVSTLLAKLDVGASYSIAGSINGRSLTVSVDSIDLNSLPAQASVTVSLEDPPTCGSGPVEVNVRVSTDNYPGETSWTVNDAYGSTLMSGGPYQTAGNTYTVTETLSNPGCMTFEISDSYGDGICCSYGSGSYQLRMNGALIKEGGVFQSSDSHIFGLEDDAPSTPGPTPSTTPSPTSNPTPIPTASPTPNPSTPPTAGPTPNPTSPPTPDTPTPPPSPEAKSCNGALVGVRVITDSYPEETGWTITNTCTGEIALTSPRYTESSHSHFDAHCLPEAQYRFTMTDEWGDGLDGGSYQVYYNTNMIASGSVFEREEISNFGIDCSE